MVGLEYDGTGGQVGRQVLVFFFFFPKKEWEEGDDRIGQEALKDQ